MSQEKQWVVNILRRLGYTEQPRRRNESCLTPCPWNSSGSSATSTESLATSWSTGWEGVRDP